MFLFYQGFGRPGQGATSLEVGPLSTVQATAPPSDLLTATPRAPLTPSTTTAQPSVMPSPIRPSTATRAPQPTAAPSKYKVKAGDTLLGIALKYGITVEALKEANGLTGDMLHIGDELVIPAPH